MYSDKEHINMLTALLLTHHVQHAVVCPGSRNAPIVHNLMEAEGLQTHAVTDERSAGFYALGLALATGRPAAVCVTSGTALLNLAPAVAEARYRHAGLVVISADRPEAWIDQLDGQTLPQPGAFGRMVARTVQLVEAHDETERWMNNRRLNEALIIAEDIGNPLPVHINVPVTEPLFDFGKEALPVERVIRRLYPGNSPDLFELREMVESAVRPMVVIGQCLPPDEDLLGNVASKMVVVAETLAADNCTAVHIDEAVMAADGDPDYRPDLIVYIGGTLVSKRTRQFLRHTKAETVVTCNDTTLADPTCNACWVATGVTPDDVLTVLAEARTDADTDFYNRWQRLLDAADCAVIEYDPGFSEMGIVKYLEEQLDDWEGSIHVHYANSWPVRLANIYASHYVWCNRGVNGIDGSVSTAAGFSLASDAMTLLVTGDLSFFYDQNALWNAALKGNFRILMINNGGGEIFRQLKGLEKSPAGHTVVAGAHSTGAMGICTQNDIGYIRATTMDEARRAIVRLLTEPVTRPMLVEVVTSAEGDDKAVSAYYEHIKKTLSIWKKENGKK